MLTIYYILEDNASQSAFFGAATMVYLACVIIIWRRIRKHRDRIRELIGAKSKALRDKLVRQLRKLLKPRARLMPSPQSV